MKNLSNYFKYYSIKIFIIAASGFANGQNYIEPQIDNPNGADISWHDDGTVTVIGGPVTFTTGIASLQISGDVADQIPANSMFLVNEEAFHANAADLGIVYGVDVATSQNGHTPNVKVQVFRRAATTPEDANVNNNFGFNFNEDNSDYLVYGTELTDLDVVTGEKTYEPWEAFAYRAHGWNINNTEVKSDDYQKLWNRPTDVAWWWSVIDLLGVVVIVAGIYFVAAAAAAGTFYEAIVTTIVGLTLRVGTIQVAVAIMSLPVMIYIGFQMKGLPNIDFRAESKGLALQTEFSTYPEVPLPPKVSSLEPGAKEYNHEIDARSRHARPCSFDANQNCIRLPLRAVVMRVEVTDAILKSISVPGSILKKTSPYQLFEKYYYDLDKTGKILVYGTELNKIPSASRFPNQIKFPRAMLETSDTQVTLEFDDYSGFPYFYLVDKERPLGFNDSYSISLGKFGDWNGQTYNLYRFLAAFSENGNPTVTLDLNPDGPFLVGDNLMTLDHPSFEDVVIANGDNQSLFKDDNSVQQEDVELTVNGDVLIFDTNDKNDLNALVATENWQFYVGAKGNSKGIAAENFAIADRKGFLPDFVFAPDYPLNTLSDMEQYVKKNKHLPNVPSQDDIDSVGYYSIDHMINGQLQNLEELYLHAFHQEKMISKNQTNSKTLRSRLMETKKSLDKLKNKQ